MYALSLYRWSRFFLPVNIGRTNKVHILIWYLRIYRGQMEIFQNEKIEYSSLFRVHNICISKLVRTVHGRLTTEIYNERLIALDSVRLTTDDTIETATIIVGLTIRRRNSTENFYRRGLKETDTCSHSMRKMPSVSFRFPLFFFISRHVTCEISLVFNAYLLIYYVQSRVHTRESYFHRGIQIHK